ncbi:MAG: restriction endonuclease subunit S [Bacteroidales bacterium]
MPFGLKDNDYKLIKNVFHSISKIEEVIVFGSRAMGTEKPGSDVDLALKGNDIKLDDIMKLKHKLEELPIIYDFDVINYETINTPALIEHIDRHGILFYKKDTVPNEWKTYKFGDLAEQRKEQVVSNGIEQPYIGLEHIEQQTLRLNGIGCSNDVISNKFKFYAGDVLYGRLRPYFRKVFNPKFDGVCSTEIFVIKNKKIIDKSYLYYLVASEEFTNIANSGSSGTHMPRADWRQLAKSEWNIPEDITAQTQIAQILTSLDDKIELNLQMNQTLEAMAKAIFKEWFVDFKFPGFDGVLVDGLPKGWRMGSVLEIATLLSGGTPKTDIPKYWNGNINWISAKDITNSNSQFVIETEKAITELGISKSAAKLLPKYSTIISARGTVGNYCILSKEMAISQSNYGLKSNLNNDYFLFLLVENMIEMMKAYSYGTVFNTITTKTFQEMEIVLPHESVINKFEEQIKPLYSKILSNQYQIQTLTQTRDSLLPRLMSGKIKV